MTTDQAAVTFDELGLAEPVLQMLNQVGYEVPTPIQARTIPPLLEGKDVLGQAQTGTGKTAAFALPLLSRIDLGQRDPQVLVLAPTRELAIQVAEAFKRYAGKMPSLHVLPIYGGQDYGIQLKMLERGVHVVVGTPGRIMDHMRRGTLRLGALRCLVLDEADEMLRMGFIDDVEWILSRTPPERQVALFSATLPAPVRRIAQSYLRDPQEILVKERTTTAATVRQRVWIVSGTHKLDALTRMLEVETFDGMIVFVRTRTATTELAERLAARGYEAAAIHGDIPQRQRERLIAQLKSGDLDILVATDVAARGLDVERVSHVVNYDVPHDTEAYVHRIGRTGRAGRTGDAILFVAPRERHMLRNIERATRQPIEVMDLPSAELVNTTRVKRFFTKVTATLENEDLSELSALIEQYQREHDADPLRVAAALAHLNQGKTPLLLKESARPPRPERARPDRDDRGPRPSGPALRRSGDAARAAPREAPADLERYRIEVGREHGVEPRNIVGAIANEAGVEARYVGRIEINDDHSVVELPAGMPKDVFQHLKKVWVAGRQLAISRLNEGPVAGGSATPQRRPKPRPRTANQDKPRASDRGRAPAKPAKRQRRDDA